MRALTCKEVWTLYHVTHMLCYLAQKDLMTDVEDQGRKVYHMDFRAVGLLVLHYLLTLSVV